MKLADKLKSEFKLTERKYLWLKVKAYGRSGQWSELSSLARAKKSLIGFAPFVEQCIAEVRICSLAAVGTNPTDRVRGGRRCATSPSSPRRSGSGTR